MTIEANKNVNVKDFLKDLTKVNIYDTIISKGNDAFYGSLVLHYKEGTLVNIKIERVIKADELQ